ncbi:MAG: hypothetical protein IPI02_11265 [Sterolibacteriaceae bacterium]|nr:hypothetical protein [Sterolibacteriaceae bacterium]
MHTLIAFATQWGSKHGGIDSFNADFLSAFAAAYSSDAQVICIVASAIPEEIVLADGLGVKLVPLPYAPINAVLDGAHARAGIAELRAKGIAFDSDITVWLGHDRFTGEPAIEAARATGGRSALIHHMSYAAYESYAESSRAAHDKEQTQRTLFEQADIALAVGPLLRNALGDLLGARKPVCMLIPGLAEIEVREAPHTFTAFLSGRLSDDAGASSKATSVSRRSPRPSGRRARPVCRRACTNNQSSCCGASISNAVPTRFKFPFGPILKRS